MVRNLFVGFSIAMMLAMLWGCSGGAVEAGSAEKTVSSSESGPLLVRTTELAAGDPCPNGGAKIEMGLDLNWNSILDADEVQKTEVVCNATIGDKGDTGDTGEVDPIVWTATGSN